MRVAMQDQLEWSSTSAVRRHPTVVVVRGQVKSDSPPDRGRQGQRAQRGHGQGLSPPETTHDASIPDTFGPVNATRRARAERERGSVPDLDTFAAICRWMPILVKFSG